MQGSDSMSLFPFFFQHHLLGFMFREFHDGGVILNGDS